MTDQTLAGASNIALYISMGLLTVAMLLFLVDLATVSAKAPRRAETASKKADAKAAEMAVAGSAKRGTASGGLVVDGDADHTDLDALSAPAGVEREDGRGAARQWAGLAMTASWLGTFALLAHIGLRAASVHRAPLGNMFEFATAGAAFAMLGFLIWAQARDLRWLGAFVVLPVLLVLGAALAVWYAEADQLMPSLQSYWLVIHVTVATLSVGLYIVGFSLAVLYLLKDHREHKAADAGGATAESGKTRWLNALPGSAALERLTYGIHVVAFPLWTFTLIAGAIWAERAWGRYWGWDPKEVWTFIIWVVYAAYMHARATTGMSTRKATWLAVAGFACIIINYTVVNMYFVGMHSYSGL